MTTLRLVVNIYIERDIKIKTHTHTISFDSLSTTVTLGLTPTATYSFIFISFFYLISSFCFFFICLYNPIESKEFLLCRPDILSLLISLSLSCVCGLLILGVGLLDAMTRSHTIISFSFFLILFFIPLRIPLELFGNRRYSHRAVQKKL